MTVFSLTLFLRKSAPKHCVDLGSDLSNENSHISMIIYMPWTRSIRIIRRTIWNYWPYRLSSKEAREGHQSDHITHKQSQPTYNFPRRVNTFRLHNLLIYFSNRSPLNQRHEKSNFSCHVVTSHQLIVQDGFTTFSFFLSPLLLSN